MDSAELMDLEKRLFKFFVLCFRKDFLRYETCLIRFESMSKSSLFSTIDSSSEVKCSCTSFLVKVLVSGVTSFEASVKTMKLCCRLMCLR